MKREELTPHVKDITRALENKENEVSEEEIEQELIEAIEKFEMTLSQAKRTIVKKHGGRASDLRTWIKLPLSELKDGDTGLELLCRVVYSSRKQIAGKSGDTKEIISGILGDGTTTRPFTAWKTTGVELNVGEVVRLKNAYVTDWRGEPQINIGDFTEIEKADSSELPSYSGSNSSGAMVEKKISEVDGSESNLGFTGKVLTVNRRTIVKDGAEKTFYYGLIADETATIPFSAWKDFSLSKGDVIRVEGAYATLWKDKPQINMSERSSVRVLDEDMQTVAPDFSLADAVDSTIRDAGKASRVNVKGRIIAIEEREITGSSGTTRMKKGLIADETGKIGFTAWCDFPYKRGDALSISGARVKPWRNRPQLNIDDSSQVSAFTGELPSIEELDRPTKMDIDTILRQSGVIDGSVDGVVVDVKNGSGLILRCPECGRVLQSDGTCSTHGEVAGVQDMRIKCVLDDGTGTVNVVMDRQLTEKILGMSMDEAQKLAIEKRNFSVIQKEVEKKLLMKNVTIRGDVLLDDYGLSCYATDVSFLEVDVEQEARKLLEEVEA